MLTHTRLPLTCTIRSGAYLPFEISTSSSFSNNNNSNTIIHRIKLPLLRLIPSRALRSRRLFRLEQAVEEPLPSSQVAQVCRSQVPVSPPQALA